MLKILGERREPSKKLTDEPGKKCEWKYTYRELYREYRTCNGPIQFNKYSNIDERLFTFCPFCGRKIEVIDD